MLCNAEFVKEREGIREFRLTSNDLRILLVPHEVGEATGFMTHYNIGSRNEGVGYTGSTHFLEHLLFKGSKNFPKDTHPINMAFARTGSYGNASTWYDWTSYLEITTAEHIGLFMEIEADRMRNATFSDEDRRDEMTVVRNEFEVGENNPSEVLENAVIAAAIREHPYHHPTIGWRSDIEGVSTERFREFYDTFYYPNNALVVVVGNTIEKDVLEMAIKYFGGVAPSPHPIPQVYTEEPPQKGERRVTLKWFGGNGIIHFAWMRPGALHEDFAALEVLRYILSMGSGSLLKRRFVDTGLVERVSISNLQLKDPYAFYLSAGLLKQTGHRAVEKEIRSYLKSLEKTGFSEEQLERAKILARADSLYKRDSISGMLMQFNLAEGAGSWELYFDLLEKIQKITPADVTRVFRKYLNSDNLTVGWFVPRRGS